MKLYEAVGHSSATIHANMQAGLDERQMLPTHAVLSMFDRMDWSSESWNEQDRVTTFASGTFTITEEDGRFSFKTRYTRPFEGLVDRALRNLYPDHANLLSSEGTDWEGQPMVMGMNAAGFIAHPFFRAAMGIEGDAGSEKLALRLTALSIAGLPEPDADVYHLMKHSLGRNSCDLGRRIAQYADMMRMRVEPAIASAPVSTRIGCSAACRTAPPAALARPMVSAPVARAAWRTATV